MIGQIEHQTVGPDTSCEYPLVGREMDVYRLSELVDSTGVYSVWGMSAVGKSSLVKNFYCERQAELKNNPGLTRGSLLTYGWVNVSRPFDLMDLSWSLLLDLDPRFLQTCRMSTMRDPIQECRQYLRMRNCFVVIDGLQSTKEWDLIKAALELETTRRHVILIITNEESIAKYCATTNELVYNVKGLQVDDTFKLLKQVSLHSTPLNFIIG
jgi:GTP-binding protein EngB required for normal cell division